MARALPVEDDPLIALAARMAPEVAGHVVLGPVEGVRHAFFAEGQDVDLAIADVSLTVRTKVPIHRPP